jgi:hypothetical protein
MANVSAIDIAKSMLELMFQEFHQPPHQLESMRKTVQFLTDFLDFQLVYPPTWKSLFADDGGIMEFSVQYTIGHSVPVVRYGFEPAKIPSLEGCKKEALRLLELVENNGVACMQTLKSILSTFFHKVDDRFAAWFAVDFGEKPLWKIYFNTFCDSAMSCFEKTEEAVALLGVQKAWNYALTLGQKKHGERCFYPISVSIDLAKQWRTKVSLLLLYNYLNMFRCTCGW